MLRLFCLRHVYFVTGLVIYVLSLHPELTWQCRSATEFDDTSDLCLQTSDVGTDEINLLGI